MNQMLSSAKLQTVLPPDVVLAAMPDFDEMFDVLMQNYRENGIYSINPAKVGAWLLMGLNRDNSSIGIIRGPGGIEAACGVYLATSWYTDDIYVEEVFNYVRPDYRRSTHAKHLIQFAKWFAENLNVPLLMGIMTTKRLAAKERLYERQLTKIGSLFLHGVPWVHDELEKNP